jgi:hypothetical protein
MESRSPPSVARAANTSSEKRCPPQARQGIQVEGR